MLLRSMQNTRELADAKPDDALRDDVPLVVVGCTSKQSVQSSAWSHHRLRRG